MSHQYDLVDLTLYVHAETDAAVRVSDTAADGPKAVWLPLSQIEIEWLDQHHREATIGVPLWLCEKSGLI